MNSNGVITADTLHRLAVGFIQVDEELSILFGNEDNCEKFIKTLSLTDSKVLTLEDFVELAFWVDLAE